MTDERTVREVLEALVRAENHGGAAAAETAAPLLHTGFVITRASKLEQTKPDYLEGLEQAVSNPNNPLRWLDLADKSTASDLLESTPKTRPFSGSGIQVRGDTAVIRAVVTTRTRETPDTPSARYRNILLLVRKDKAEAKEWVVMFWQTAEITDERFR
ncbi:MAG: hypothetical protein QOF70_7398 [Acetobacteraceae bacterium]|jgi:hypothetical protein|nr:hypothetical protein [Acetobacteraceae bacterium]